MVKTWVMDVIRTQRGPANGIRASKWGQTIQVERMAAVCKSPKNRESVHMVHIRFNGG